MTILFVKRFTVLDFARLRDGQFEGESVFVDAELEGDLDERGFLMDFGPVKRWLKRIVDDAVDHRLAVPADRADARGFVDSEGLRYRCPEEALALMPAVDLPSVAEFLRARAMAERPENVSNIRFILREAAELEAQPSYRYTHGLKLHDGNCQRLIHGHRNIVEVFVDGEPSRQLASTLAKLFADVHFVNIEDLVVPRPVGVRAFDDTGWVSVSYRSAQGEFWAEIPAARILPLESEPTVENIAAFAHAWLVDHHSVDAGRLAVRAYEGLNKGALAS